MVKQASAEVKAILTEYGEDVGPIAIGLVMVEYAVEQEEKG